MTCNVLAIDPGKMSGYCYMEDGSTRYSGEITVDTATGFERAREIVATCSPDTHVVIEACGYGNEQDKKGKRKRRYDTNHRLGVRAGTWETLARLRGLTVVWIHPDEWQRKMLHPSGRNPGRDLLKRFARAVAGVDHENEADARCLARYYAAKRRIG